MPTRQGHPPREIQDYKDHKVSRDFRAIKALWDRPVMEYLLLERCRMKPVLIQVTWAVMETLSLQKIQVPGMYGMEMNGFQSDKFKGLKVRKDNRVLRALKDHKVILVRKEPKENKALKDCKGRKDHKVRQALKVLKGLLVRREKMDLLVRKALRDHKVPKAQSVQPELKALPDHKVRQAL